MENSKGGARKNAGRKTKDGAVITKRISTTLCIDANTEFIMDQFGDSPSESVRGMAAEIIRMRTGRVPIRETINEDRPPSTPTARRAMAVPITRR